MEQLLNGQISDVIKNFEKFRTEKALTIQMMADKLCISANTYKRIEQGFTTVSLDRLFHIAHILNVPAFTLLMPPDASIYNNILKAS